MAVAVAKQPGVATHCFGVGAGGGGTRASRRVAGGQVCPIDLAAQNGVPELMRALIENGARVTGRDGEGALRV